MPSWINVLREINSLKVPDRIDRVRRKYLAQLSEYTKRNTIIYYSGWLQHPNMHPHAMIYDGDINGFMAVINGLDTKKGLDLLLHTPGGVTAATEAIVSYLRKKFYSREKGFDIRCFVPQLAMSGGTMIACACKEIVMGKQSSIGPIDPQFGSMAALGVLEEFNRAAEEIKENPGKIPLWQSIYAKIPAGFLTECQQAVDWSEQLVRNWLKSGMFNGQKDAAQRTRKIVDALNNHHDTKAHGRHIDADRAREIGLSVVDLESDNELQDLVLTVHHACMHTFSDAQRLQKIIENQNGIGMFTNAG